MTLIPNLRLSKVQMGVRIKNHSLRPPMSLQELTINLPKNPRLQGMSHHHQLTKGQMLNMIWFRSSAEEMACSTHRFTAEMVNSQAEHANPLKDH